MSQLWGLVGNPRAPEGELWSALIMARRRAHAKSKSCDETEISTSRGGSIDRSRDRVRDRVRDSVA